MMRYVIKVMYDGTKFHGSQVQGGTPTVQLALNTTLSVVFRRAVSTYGASRTDEGVHALCNCYHFDTDTPISFDLLYRCNAILPAGIALTRLYQVADDFNARFDAVARRYRYRIYMQKNPFLHQRALFFPLPLNENVLHETAGIITEYKQFESFAKRRSQSNTFDCTIRNSSWEQKGDELHYVVEANRFLRGMVRGLVGTQLQAARGKLSVDGFRGIIEARDCTKAFFDVAGHGLYLEHIEYPTGMLTPCLHGKAVPVAHCEFALIISITPLQGFWRIL
ncbi:MAG: tRNA pseudouridine synthase A [Taibaiella sp.]|nr:tRNA pseudouridine synthase A [Taibaiella sp.]